MEAAPCGVCGASDALVLFHAEDPLRIVPGEAFPVGRCRRCSHIYLAGRPAEADIGRYYPPEYRAHRDAGEPRERKGSHRHRRIRRLPPFRILDVGCGSGYDLLGHRDRGCEVYGIEPDPEAAGEARRSGVAVYNGSLEGADFPAGRFQVVTMNYSLEHLYDPRKAFANLLRMTAPDGEVHLLFPTADGILFRLFRGSWHHLDVPRHLQFFTHDSFSRLCRETGFRVTRRGCDSGARSLRRSMGYAGRNHALARAAHGLLQTRPCRWYARVATRLAVDALRLGDVAAYTIRPGARIKGPSGPG